MDISNSWNPINILYFAMSVKLSKDSRHPGISALKNAS